MPKQIVGDDAILHRRRGAHAMALEAEEERGFAMRMLLRSPKDLVAGALVVAAVGAILTNALFLQAGHHPAPMFGSAVNLSAPSPAITNPLPRPRPAQAVTPAEPVTPETTKPVETKRVEPRAVEAKSIDPKNPDPMTSLVMKSTGAPSGVMRPPAPIPGPSRSETTQSAGSRRVAAVQRALTEYGYGQLKPTGTIGADTQSAISKFERDRKLPVTGQMSDRVVRELAAMTGRPID